MNSCDFYSYRIIGKTDLRSFRSSVCTTNRGLFHFLLTVFPSHLKSRVVLTLTKVATLRIMLKIDGVSITSKSHTHPSHSQTSRLLTSSLSLGVPVPRTTQGGQEHRTTFLTTLKVKVGSTLVKTATLRITLNIDGVSITSRTHTHPSHSQTSRLLTSSLSLGVPLPPATQCM